MEYTIAIRKKGPFSHGSNPPATKSLKAPWLGISEQPAGSTGKYSL